jgi:DNA-binding PadR family transcriptional regulator
MYELFVLGQLMSDNKHGYLLQERLKHAVGPIREISSGTLYPLLSRLVESGWINLRLEDEAGARPRKIYEMTEAGRRRFHELMASPLEYSMDSELIFHFKLIFFHYVTKDVQHACLEQYAEYLRHNLKYVDSLSQMFNKKQIDNTQLRHLLRMLDHRKHVGSADLQWVTDEIEQTKTDRI